MDEHLDVVKLMSGVNEAPEPSKAFSEALARNLAKLSEVYQRELTPLAVLGYRDALKDLPPEQVDRGFDLAIKNCDFVTPAAVRRYGLGEQEPRTGDPCYAETRQVIVCDNCYPDGWRKKIKIPGTGYQVVARCDHK